MKHVVTYKFGDTVRASIMTPRQLAEVKPVIVEVLDVEDHKAEEVLARVEASIAADDAPKKAATSPSFSSM